MNHKIILDCDPGHDDAIPILLAAHHPDIELLAITTVAGNQSVDKTTTNALKVCSLADIRNVPVAKGVDRPLVRPAQHDPEEEKERDDREAPLAVEDLAAEEPAKNLLCPERVVEDRALVVLSTRSPLAVSNKRH